MSDTRLGDRQPATMRVKLKYPDVETFIQKYSVNISRGGIFIATRSPKPVGTQLRFEFVLASAEVAIRGEGVVQWTKDARPDDPRAAGMGIRFTHLDPGSQAVIDRALSLRREAPASAQVEPTRGPDQGGFDEEEITATSMPLDASDAGRDDHTNPMALPPEEAPADEEPARELSIEAELPGEAELSQPRPRHGPDERGASFLPARTVNILEARTEVLPPAESKGKAVTAEDLDALAASWGLDRGLIAQKASRSPGSARERDSALRALEELTKQAPLLGFTKAEALAKLPSLLDRPRSKP